MHEADDEFNDHNDHPDHWAPQRELSARVKSYARPLPDTEAVNDELDTHTEPSELLGW